VSSSPASRAVADADLLRTILAALPVGVTVQDASGRLVLANAGVAEQLGLGSDDGLPLLAASSAESGPIHCGEETVPTTDGTRTLLTAQRSITTAEGRFVIAASLDVSEQKDRIERLLHRLHFDELTGLANRTTLERRTVEAITAHRDGARFALVFIDLDNFKHINDYYNHAVGDALLVAVGERVGALMRPSDVLARISGDEFVLLFDPVADEADLRERLEAVQRALTRPFYLEGFEILTSGSIGASMFPDHGEDFETLRRNADSAMYRAKASDKGAAVLFDPVLGSEVASRMALEQQLRLAIRDRSFCCAFQPKVDLRSHAVVGFETLIRWRDDKGTIHPPSAFIGLATELGLIDPITLFVLEDSSEMVSRLDVAYGDQTTISINVAARQASDPRFMATFLDTLRGIDCAHRYMVELTEDAFVGDGTFQTKFLPQLRELGVKISIDDFGTGYSSLAVLSAITADELKIDRSFITAIHQRPRSQSVLKAIESLGEALGMSIIAEGVETYEEAAYLLAASRIRFAQGFYFSKPFYLDEIGGGHTQTASTRTQTSARGGMQLRDAASARAGLGGRLAS
jgi:cyclic di-GMP phosphodiesterase Gmr